MRCPASRFRPAPAARRRRRWRPTSVGQSHVGSSTALASILQFESAGPLPSFTLSHCSGSAAFAWLMSMSPRTGSSFGSAGRASSFLSHSRATPEPFSAADGRLPAGRSSPRTQVGFSRGRVPGRPITTQALSHQLARHGVRAEHYRLSALYQLAAKMPAPLLADILGLSPRTAEVWSRLASRTSANYPEMRGLCPRPPPPPLATTRRWSNISTSP